MNDVVQTSNSKVYDDGELWSFIRRCMAQGKDIHLDHAERTYEEYSARLDAAALERLPELQAYVVRAVVAARGSNETRAPHLSDLWVARLMDRHGFLAPVASRMGDLIRDAFRSGQEALGLPEDDRGPYCPQLALPCDRMCQTICNRRAKKAGGVCGNRCPHPLAAAEWVACELAVGHEGVHRRGGWSWIRQKALEPCTRPAGQHALALDADGNQYCTWCDWPKHDVVPKP